MSSVWSIRVDAERREQLRMIRDLTGSRSMDQVLKILIQRFYEYQRMMYDKRDSDYNT